MVKRGRGNPIQRAFTTLAAEGALAMALSARAPQVGKVWRIGSCLATGARPCERLLRGDQSDAANVADGLGA
jgi:hypothetical protein